MNPEIFKNKKWLAIALFVALIVIIVFLSFRAPKQGNAPASQGEGVGQTPTSTSVSTSTESGVSPVKSQQGARVNIPKTVSKTSAISMVTPALGEIWALGKLHSVRWSHEGGSSGAIALLDASSKIVIGWITPELSSQQVVYSWDTASVALGRKDPQKKNISAGTYIVKVVFDGSRSPVESVPFAITGTANEKILTSEVLIRSGRFFPNFFTIKQGERVAIINDDSSLTHIIKMSGVNIATLSPRDSYVFNATQPGNYEFRLADDILAKLTVVVE